MERYKGYRVPLATVKVGSLLQKLADREQTTSFDILNSATKLDPQEPKVVGPLTSPEELLEALDLAIGPDGEDLEYHGRGQPEPLPPHGEIGPDHEAALNTLSRRRRRTKRELQAAADGRVVEEPRFVELTKLFPPMPKKGNFEVNTVKKSLYFFS